MNSRISATLPALLCIASVGACSAELPETPNLGRSTDSLTACPAPYWNDDQTRAAATLAFNLMKLAAVEARSSGNLLAARSILAPQRYTYMSGTTCFSWGCQSAGIQFDSSDPLYSHVTDTMKAELAFAQLDAKVGSYLANGLWRARVFTDGTRYPSIFAIPALAQFAPGKTTSVHLTDATSASDSHYATISSQTWCNTTSVSITESVNKSWSYQPVGFLAITDWRSRPSSYVGVTGGKANGQTISNAQDSFTPFMGTDGQNPYLLIAINGTPQNWAYENLAPVNCWNNSGYTCNSSLQIDPIPYAEPGDFYNNSHLVGTQSNPFALSGTTLYADPYHAGQWATRVANNVQEWGTFTTPVVLFGTTKYKYAKQM